MGNISWQNIFHDDSLTNEVHAEAADMLKAAAPLEQKHEAIQVRDKGMILGLDLGNGEAAKAIVGNCFENGILIVSCGSGGRVVKLIPPLTIDEPDLKAELEILVNACEEVMEAA